jgi:hypothetical protein
MKKPLSWYEDNAAEVKYNTDGSVTYIFDEPGPDDPITHQRPTSSTTISKEDYEAATKDPRVLV